MFSDWWHDRNPLDNPTPLEMSGGYIYIMGVSAQGDSVLEPVKLRLFCVCDLCVHTRTSIEQSFCPVCLRLRHLAIKSVFISHPFGHKLWLKITNCRRIPYDGVTHFDHDFNTKAFQKLWQFVHSVNDAKWQSTNRLIKWSNNQSCSWPIDRLLNRSNQSYNWPNYRLITQVIIHTFNSI